jgi:hypothetical protein
MDYKPYTKNILKMIFSILVLIYSILIIEAYFTKPIDDNLEI